MLNMKKSLLLLLLMAFFLMPSYVSAQVYVSDYTFSTYPGSFTSIASTGTELTDAQGDDVSASLSLPFTFPFGQDSCSQVMVSSNGQIGIGSADPAYNGFEVHGTDMSIISPLAMDYNLDSTYDGHGHIYYETFGTAPNRYTVVEFNQIRPYGQSSDNLYTFQVFLYETGDIEFVYDTCLNIATQQAYVFIHEFASNRTLGVSGTWSTISPSFVVQPISISNANRPISGLTLTFTRPIGVTCPRPLNFACNASTRPDSISFVWNPAPNTTAWELRWDTIGTLVDSMLYVAAPIDSFYVVTSMTAGGRYHAYLRTDCGDGYSFWEGPVEVTPGSYNMPVTGTHSIYACGGVIYDDGGSTGNYSENCNSILVIYPTDPDSIVTLSGTLNTQASNDYLYVYDGVGTSGALLYQGSGLNQVVPLIRSYQGPLTLRFTSTAYTNYGGFALHVVCQRAPLCRYVGSVDVDHVAGGSAFFSWEVVGIAPEPAYYVVKLFNLDDPTAAPFEDTTSAHNYFFSNLDATTHYSATVMSICGTDTIVGDTLTFLTRCYAGGVSNPSGTGTSTTYLPCYSSWGNTFSQSIYTASELTAMGLSAGPIRGITYHWNSAGSYEKELVVFLGHTTNSTFSTFAPLTGSMTQVYSGIRPTSHVGVVEYTFDTPFFWDGVSNLVLTTFVNQPAGATHYSSGFSGYATNAGSNRSIYCYRDNTAFTVSGISSSMSGNHSTSTYRPNVSFIMPCDSTATCVAPNLFVERVTSDTVVLRWAAGISETAWNVDYRIASDAGWTNVATATGSTSYIFSGLTPETEYQFRVTPDCGGDSIFATAEATTSCVPVSVLPFTENFENFTAPSTTGSGIVECWHRGTNYSYTNYPYLYTSRGYSGNNSIYFYSSSSYYSYLALPAIAAPIDTLQVSFAAYKTSASYTIQVGVMTDPNDFTTFSLITTVSPTDVNSWEMFEVPLSSYSGDGQYIALATSNATSYMYIDDIEVSHIPSCPRPTDVTVNSITTSTATVHWSDTAANYFIIEYGPSGFAHGDGITLTSSTDSVNLYGLRHSSSYDVYIRGLCGSSDTSNWSFVTTFATACGIIDSLPYSQNFSGWGAGTGARPNCWGMGGYSSYPYIVNIADDLGNITGQTLYMYTYYSGAPTYASLPELDSVSYPINLVQTVFRAWANNTNSTSYSHQLVVGVCSTQGDLATFSPIDTIQVTAEPMLYEVSFDTAAGLGKYVTFVSVVRPSTSGGYTVYYNSVYIDSIALELIPDCQRPNRLSATPLSATSATLTWNERNTPLGAQIEYGPLGFVLGTGTRVTTTSSPYSATGLIPSTTYQYYVRSICAAGDTSQWSRIPGSFTTFQNPAPVPYFYDFESGAEWDNWQTVSNSTINWYRDTAAGNGTNGFDATGSYAMFVSPDSGATYATRNTEVVNATAYRDFDFGTVDSSYLLTFRAKAGGTTSAGYDGLMVFLVDPNVEVLPSSLNLETPWGNVQDMTYLAFVRLSTNWNTYSAILDTLTGVHRLAFYWFNQNTASLEGTFVGGPGAVDDIRINYISCPRPAGVRATHVSMASAQVTWHGPDYGDYRVTCRTPSGNIIANQLVHTNSISFTGLNPSTTYNVYVRRLCSPTDSSQLSLAGSFTTLICNDGYLDTIGSTASTTTSYNLPVSNYYNYSYSQQILTPDELSGSGEISAISFRYAGSSAMTAKTNCTIYMGHTSLSSFASQSDFVDPATLQVVYTGSLNCQPGWNRFILEFPFLYNGTSNLVIAIDDNSGGYNTSSYTFYVSPCSGTRSFTMYSDSNNPDASSADNLALFSGNHELMAMRTQMIIETCPPNSCPTPIVREPIIRSNSVTLRWRNTSDAYQVGYRRAITSSWITAGANLTDTFFVIRNIQPNTDYVYRVRQYCDSTGVSNWYVGSFNTADIPCLSPSGLEVTALTNRSASFNWTPEENNLSYRLHVFNSSYDRVINRYVHSGTVNDLEANVTYYAAVQASCQGFDEPSAWSDTIRFTTDFCPSVTNLTYSDLQGNSVVLDWTEGGRASQWEIQYGMMGFSAGTGTSITVDHHPYTLTGLTGETEYDIYVRAICGDNFYSEHWSNKVSIETPYSGLSSVADDSRLQLHPNPASASVTVTLTGVQGRAIIEVMDVTGRRLRQQEIADATAQPNYLIDLTSLPAGSYFVRVTGDSITALRKLIVK